MAPEKSLYAQIQSVIPFVSSSLVPINGNWGEWKPWGNCSQPCGKGQKSRSRLCDDPAPEHGGAPCTGDDKETAICEEKECPYGKRCNSLTDSFHISFQRMNE